jgi:hypothetical protein
MAIQNMLFAGVQYTVEKHNTEFRAFADEALGFLLMSG